MEYSDLGATGVTISVVRLGLAATGATGLTPLVFDDHPVGRTDRFVLERHAHEMLEKWRSGPSSSLGVLLTW